MTEYDFACMLDAITRNDGKAMRALTDKIDKRRLWGRIRLWVFISWWWKEAGKNQYAPGGRGRIRHRAEWEADSDCESDPADLGPVAKVLRRVPDQRLALRKKVRAQRLWARLRLWAFTNWWRAQVAAKVHLGCI